MMIVEKPKSITMLSKEQLEDMCLNLMHIDNEKAKIIDELEWKIERIKKILENQMDYREFVDIVNAIEEVVKGE